MSLAAKAEPRGKVGYENYPLAEELQGLLAEIAEAEAAVREREKELAKMGIAP